MQEKESSDDCSVQTEKFCHTYELVINYKIGFSFINSSQHYLSRQAL